MEAGRLILPVIVVVVISIMMHNNRLTGASEIHILLNYDA